jgi:hypothetical protein
MSAIPVSGHVAVSTALPTVTTPRLVAGLAVLQVALFAVPMVVLGRAIGWPASLRLPASEALPLVAANLQAVLVGYWAYLLVSVAMVPLAFALRSLAAERGRSGPMIDALAFLGAAAGILKTLGIVRWLSAMPALATAHAGADAAGRATIETAYLALNAYAGSVGELLGVQLLSGLWLLGTAAVLVGIGLRLTGLLGGLAGLLFLATTLRTFDPAIAALQSVAVPLALLWFLVLAAAMLRRRAA